MTVRVDTLSLMPPFSFLSNHGLALLCIADDPRSRMRDIAGSLDITERAAQRIVADLVEAGYVDRERDGRRNNYTVQRDLRIALPLERDVEIGSLLSVLVPGDSTPERRTGVGAS
jgi:predicted transcriptional regulator